MQKKDDNSFDYLISFMVLLPPDNSEILIRCLAPSKPNMPKYFLASKLSTPSNCPHKYAIGVILGGSRSSKC